MNTSEAKEVPKAAVTIKHPPPSPLLPLDELNPPVSVLMVFYSYKVGMTTGVVLDDPC